MSEDQRATARKMIAAALSERGRLQLEAIIALESVLAVMEGTARRDPGLYYFTVFGSPGGENPWGWRVEGHHLSINLTVAGHHISATPFFFGADPAEVRVQHAQKGRRALAQEEDLARQLIRALNATQRKTAVIASRAPSDIITGANRTVNPEAPSGLAYINMTPGQQDQLRALVDLYVGRLRADAATRELAAIAKAGWNLVHFAWAGGLEPGEGHYYRIQGPEFLIEYDNTQDDANHIHTVWRKFEGDFGRDILREHYQRGHSGVR
jgi:hypothetical protein